MYKRQVLDIKFHPDHLPNLLNAIEIDNNGQKLVVDCLLYTSRCV